MLLRVPVQPLLLSLPEFIEHVVYLVEWTDGCCQRIKADGVKGGLHSIIECCLHYQFLHRNVGPVQGGTLAV